MTESDKNDNEQEIESIFDESSAKSDDLDIDKDSDISSIIEIGEDSNENDQVIYDHTNINKESSNSERIDVHRVNNLRGALLSNTILYDC